MVTLEIKTFHGNALDGNMWKQLKNVLGIKSQQQKEILSAKEKATAQGQPFVEVVNVNFDNENPADGYFELEWNEIFVEQLRRAGYQGTSQEEIVDSWFTQLCRGIGAEDEFS